MTWLIAARAFQGIGVAGVSVIVLKLTFLTTLDNECMYYIMIGISIGMCVIRKKEAE